MRQLRIELLGIEPVIWRRIQIPVTYTFWDLHVAIQSAFGWNDSHLHEFVFRRGPEAPTVRLGIPLADDFGQAEQDRPLPGWKHVVSEVMSESGATIRYVYDFGDHWDHRIVVEDRLRGSPGKRYPRCIAGERAGPPDDCGGPTGYTSLIETLADPDAEDHKDMAHWAASIKGLRGRFDPDAFDEQQVRFGNPTIRLKRMLRDIG